MGARATTTRRSAACNDLVQEVFLACVEALGRLADDRRFRSYLFAVAYRALCRHYRDRRRDRGRIDYTTASAQDLSPSPTGLIAERDEQRLLLAGLRRVPVDAQVILELVYWERMTAAEIGAVLDEPPAERVASLTATGTVMGTPAYMAPEQHLGRPSDARTDLFAFCVTLWEALCGERPFPGETLHALAAAVLEGRRRAPPRGRRAPPWLWAALERGLQRDPVELGRGRRPGDPGDRGGPGVGSTRLRPAVTRRCSRSARCPPRTTARSGGRSGRRRPPRSAAGGRC